MVISLYLFLTFTRNGFVEHFFMERTATENLSEIHRQHYPNDYIIFVKFCDTFHSCKNHGD